MITAFRDGFQSVYGARVLTPDFLPAVEAAAAAGIDHFEAGGGARFQSLYFYCNEDAFDMMDSFRKAAGPNANLQTLSRGVNVVGLDSQSRDIIKLHAKLFKKHGMTTIRNFDALNDVNNLIDSGRAIHEAGLKHEVCVTMMALPPGLTGAHDPAFYTKTLKYDSRLPTFLSIRSVSRMHREHPFPQRYTKRSRKRESFSEKTRTSSSTATRPRAPASSSYKAALDAGAEPGRLFDGARFRRNLPARHHRSLACAPRHRVRSGTRLQETSRSRRGLQELHERLLPARPRRSR